MVQHKCGTCQHFEESGIPGSGWCRHPLRHDIQHVVLVRKSELACRDGWAGDLWEARSTLTAVSSVNGASKSSSLQPVQRGDERQYTDRVKAVAVQAGPSQIGTGASPPITHGAVDVARAAGAKPVEDIELPAQVVRRAELAGHLEGARPETTPRQAAPADAPSANRVSQTSIRQSPLKQDVSGSSQAAVRPPTSRIPEPGVRFPSERPAEPLTPRQVAMSSTPQADTRAEDEPRQYGWTEPLPRPETLRTEILRNEWGNAPDNSTAKVMPDAVPAPAAVEPQHQRRAAGPISERLIDLPRCCQTCRDFRPIEGGERGWCNNPYAFSKRTQVDARELSCETTIGSWWMAADDWWLDQGDITHHGRPTPNVDDLLLQLLKGKPRRSPNNRRA